MSDATCLAFRRLHAAGCFVMPNPWDVGSARVLAQLGFAALATTSAGFAWSRGRRDTEVDLDDMLGHLREIAAAVDVPVNADFEDGFAVAPETVAANVRAATATGVAGLSIEDSTGDAAAPLFARTLAVERIRAAREAIDGSGTGVLLTGRSEGFIAGRPDLDETIARLTAYAAAGADCVYAPGLRTAAEIAAVVTAVAPTPVNLLVYGDFITVAEATRARRAPDQRGRRAGPGGVDRPGAGGARNRRPWHLLGALGRGAVVGAQLPFPSALAARPGMTTRSATLSLMIMVLTTGPRLAADTHRFTPQQFYNTYSFAHPPALRIKPGDRVITKTIDAAGVDCERQGRRAGPNPQTGPFYVEGAEPGDLLVVTFEKIETNRATAYSSSLLAPYAVDPASIATASDRDPKRVTWTSTRLPAWRVSDHPDLKPATSRCRCARCSAAWRWRQRARRRSRRPPPAPSAATWTTPASPPASR